MDTINLPKLDGVINKVINPDYIHNWSLQPFSQDYDLASHTTYVEYVTFVQERWDL